MYKNQLQEVAQRSCFNLPSYTCIREGPDHAPRFKVIVDFNGHSPHFCSNLRLAENSAAEAALISLSSRLPSFSRILDETGVYKKLLQEIAQRVGSPLPRYAAYRSGEGHLPVLTGTESRSGEKPPRTRSKLRRMLPWQLVAQKDAGPSSEHENDEEREHIRIARALQKYCMTHKIDATKKFSVLIRPPPRPSSPETSASKTLWLLTPSGSRPLSIMEDTTSQPLPEVGTAAHLQRYPAPFVQSRRPYRGIALPVTMRSTVPVFSAPPPPAARLRPSGVAPPVRMRQAVPFFSAPPTAETPSFSNALAPSEKLLQGNSTCEEDVLPSNAWSKSRYDIANLHVVKLLSSLDELFTSSTLPFAPSRVVMFLSHGIEEAS